MTKHPFIFEPGHWLGEGKITLSMMEEKELPFFTRWTIPLADEKGMIHAMQEIQIAGLSDIMQNEFTFFDQSKEGFAIQLDNQSIGKVVGAGRINPDVIAWEFRLGHLGFEGFEFYELSKEPDVYQMHAEYATADDFRTIIHGKVWRKLEETSEEQSSESK